MQISRSIVSFVFKTEHFEYLSSPSYVTSSWVPWQSCFVWKKAFPFHFQQIEHFRYNKWCLCESVLALKPRIAAVVNRIEFQMVSLTSRRPYLCPSEGHSYGISILSFINLRGKVRKITRERYTAQTWNLEKLFIYLSSIIFEIHSFCSWMVSNLFFDCVTVKTSNTFNLALWQVFIIFLGQNIEMFPWNNSV